VNGLDLFSGIGGISIALAPWVRTIAYCEQDEYAQGVLLSRMRDGSLDRAPIFTDVRELRSEHFATKPSIIFGGFPCQDISIAKKDAKGLDGKRSALFFEVVRLTRELRPSFVFLENVPAITLRGLERVLLEFTALGYNCRWTIVSAGELGAPHLRERWWLLAHSMREGLQESWSEQIEEEEPRGSQRDSSLSVFQAHIWHQSPSVVCRMDDGIRPKTHRIRCLGNAVVPIAAREAFRRLIGIEGNGEGGISGARE
jgi:DNA (cytosine-5)-methyltransferase 1